MKRAGTATLALIEPLLAALRAHPALRERTPGHFCLGRREVLHFHSDPAGVFADVRLSGGFERLPATTAAEQADVLDRIEACVDSIEARRHRRNR
jgi:hypothetical protein